MRVLGLETSCDETGVALYDSERGLLGDALFSQIDLHRVYGGVPAGYRRRRGCPPGAALTPQADGLTNADAGCTRSGGMP